MWKTLVKFWRSENGVTAVEYGLIASLIGLAISAAVVLTGASLRDLFLTIADCFASPRGPLC